MVPTFVKMAFILFLTVIGFQHHSHGLQVAAILCFVVSAGLVISVILDVIRFCRQKDVPAEEKPQPRPEAVPPVDPESHPVYSGVKIGKTYRVSNVSQFLENIHSLALENPEYKLSESEIIGNYMTDKRIWKYDFKPKSVELLPEPENPRSMYSIKVLIDGKQVGSLESGGSSPLLKAMKGPGVEVVYCTIGGGPYKVVYEDEHTGRYSLLEDEKNYSVTLSIYEK